MLFKSTSIIECENGMLRPSEIFKKSVFHSKPQLVAISLAKKTLALLALVAGFYRHAVPTVRKPTAIIESTFSIKPLYAFILSQKSV